MSDERCQEVVLNLLMLRNQVPPLPAVYVRELWQTVRCPQLKELAKTRKDYADQLGEATTQRILQFQETDEDISRATQAVTHYWRWDGRNLRRSLSWSSWGF